MPLCPSTSAVAGAVFLTSIYGLLLKPPALSRRMYCGRRNTPWPSAPVRSASVISSATFAAWAGVRPPATRASPMSEETAAAGTRGKLSLMSGCLFTDQLQRPAAEDRVLVGVGHRQRPHLPHAFECAHVVGIVAAEHDA